MPKLTGSAPVLLVKDVMAAAEYFRDKVGFGSQRLYGEPPDFAMVSRDGLTIMLAQLDEGKSSTPYWQLVDKMWNAYFWVDDAEALYAEVIASGAIIDYTLYTTPYGVKEFGIQDLDDHDIGFGQVIRLEDSRVRVEQQPSGTDRLVIKAEYARHTPQRLFECLTDPALLAVWWTPESEIDGRVGGAYHLWWTQMNWHLRGAYREFAPGKRLVFTWKWDHEPDLPERVVEIDFEVSASGAGLALTQGFYSASDADAEDRKGHIDGWLYFLPLIDNVDKA